jgi:hypothetical protein
MINMVKNQEYSNDEINKMYDELLEKYNDNYEGVNIKCEVKKCEGKYLYFYYIDGIPTHKCVAVKLINQINKKKKNKKRKILKQFDNNLFH